MAAGFALGAVCAQGLKWKHFNEFNKVQEKRSHQSVSKWVNKLRPRQNGRHFIDDIFLEWKFKFHRIIALVSDCPSISNKLRATFLHVSGPQLLAGTTERGGVWSGPVVLLTLKMAHLRLVKIITCRCWYWRIKFQEQLHKKLCE